MKTLVIKDDMRRASQLIKDGALVAVPTETVYGLACNGLNEAAVERIYEVKGRPPVKPLSLMVSGKDAMERYCINVPHKAKLLADKYWPGPLTIVLEAADCVPDIVRAGGKTVGLRCPDHPLTLEALRLSGLPFAAPSANPSGAPSPKSARTVAEYFDGSIEAIIDGGECGIGKESTLIDMSALPYRILREAALSRDEIADTLVDSMKIIGITGGSGCGKTSALRCLEKQGAYIIDCDALYHCMLKEDGQLRADIEAAFPGVTRDGEVDRKELGRRVFTDSKSLEILNGICHTHISRRVHELLREQAMLGAELAAIDAVELISSGLSDRCDAVLSVLADRDIRISRIMARDNISRESAELRINAQRPESYYLENSSHVLYNNGDLNLLETEIIKILKEIQKNG